MERKSVGIFLLILGIAWFVLGIIFYSAAIPTIGGTCDEICVMWNAIGFLGVVIPSVIFLIVAVLLFTRKKKS